MNIGPDVLTKTLIGNTSAEKVLTPWWITLQHYLVYFLVALGLIAVPINPTLSVLGNCSYNLSSPHNYLLPHRICRLENDTIVVLHKYADYVVIHDLNMTQIDGNLKYKFFKSRKYIASLRDIQTRIGTQPDQNYDGCYIRSNPRLFGHHVYWKCVNENLNPITLYFPYLVLTIGLVLVSMERVWTRYLWTGKRIEKFYDLLIKDVLETGDIEKVDTKENRQKCRQINYEFKNSWFYSQAYISQTVIKLAICLAIIIWSFFLQSNHLRDSFRTTIQCRVFDYAHECSIPSSGMNLVIFDLVNIVLFLILIAAGFNVIWHLRIKTDVQLDHDNDVDDSSKDSSGFLKNISKSLKRIYRNWRPTKLTRLVETHLQGIAAKNQIRNLDHLRGDERVLYEIYILSPDMQLLLNLLAAQEGIWSSILVLSIFDKSFKDEFRVRDSQITSNSNVSSSRRRDITIAWNEPIAAQFLGHNVSKEHLMYVMEIDPPIDKLDDGVTMMPACSVNGENCVYEPIQPNSRKVSVTSCNSNDTKPPLSRQESAASIFDNPDKSMTIIDGGVDDHDDQFIEIKQKSKIKTNLARKVALLYGRKRSADKVREFKNTLAGLRVDTEYIIKISFVLSGKKLGSESYRILGSNDGQCRKITSPSSLSSPSSITPKPSIQSSRSRSSSIGSMMHEPPMTNPDRIRKSVGQRLEPLPESLNENVLVAKSSEEVKVLLKKNPNNSTASSSVMVVLNFVATWCSICSKVEPQMEVSLLLFCEFHQVRGLLKVLFSLSRILLKPMETNLQSIKTASGKKFASSKQTLTTVVRQAKPLKSMHCLQPSL